MTTAYVLSGGGSLAAAQVGMMQALSERGIRPDMVVGTSAGAVNAAFVGAYGVGWDALEDLAQTACFVARTMSSNCWRSWALANRCARQSRWHIC